MKTRILWTLLCSCLLLNLQAQEKDPCSLKLQWARYYLHGNKLVKPDTDRALRLLAECMASGGKEAYYMMGDIYKGGYGVPTDDQKSFENLTKAANMGHMDAAFDLGIVYRHGIGVKINFDKALEWFETAASYGHDRANYEIGYLYLKGIGVPQNYQKAIQYFEQSTYPMAKHFQGICHYFGYGVPMDKDRGIVILLENPITRSQTIVESLAGGDREEQLRADTKKQLAYTPGQDKTDVAPAAISEVKEEITRLEEEQESIPVAKLHGNWKGKLIEYDWSGEQIVRISPIMLQLDMAKKDQYIHYTLGVDGKEYHGTSAHGDNSLYFSDLTINLERLYSSNPTTNRMDWQVLAASLRLKTFNGLPYLIGGLETWIPGWREPGTPMRIVLSNPDTMSQEEDGLSEEIIQELAAQEEQFITLYPNPFREQLLIQYELDQPGRVTVETYSYMGMDRRVLESGKLQEKGKHTYNLNGTGLPKGLYIVKVSVNDMVHTRMVLKEL